MTTRELLQLITQLGLELLRRGEGGVVPEVQALRRYYAAVRRGDARPPSYAFTVAAGETWSAARIRERVGSLGMLEVAVSPYQSSRAVKRGNH